MGRQTTFDDEGYKFTFFVKSAMLDNLLFLQTRSESLLAEVRTMQSTTQKVGYDAILTIGQMQERANIQAILYCSMAHHLSFGWRNFGDFVKSLDVQISKNVTYQDGRPTYRMSVEDAGASARGATWGDNECRNVDAIGASYVPNSGGNGGGN